MSSEESPPANPPSPSRDKSSYVLVDRSPTPQEEFEERFEGEEGRTARLKNDLAEQDINQRHEYAQRAYGVVITWIIVICLVITCHFVVKTSSIPSFTPAEFIAIITTTTASAFGFWLLVGQGLFPKN